VDTVAERPLAGERAAFHAEFTALFNADFPRIFRYLDRLSGEPDLAADLAQEAFVRLYRRGVLPEQPQAWLITVAMNLFRNVKSSRSRRRELLTLARGEECLADPPPSPAAVEEAAEIRRRVRAALDQLPERERHLLLLRAEGYSYRDLAGALGLNEASVGVMLARAKVAFRVTYGDHPDER
jgi:RNA polymerase sigma-70 factor (ECF subfamily)